MAKVKNLIQIVKVSTSDLVADCTSYSFHFPGNVDKVSELISKAVYLEKETINKLRHLQPGENKSSKAAFSEIIMSFSKEIHELNTKLSKLPRK